MSLSLVRRQKGNDNVTEDVMTLNKFNLYYNNGDEPEILLHTDLDEASLKNTIKAFEIASDINYYQNLRIELQAS